MSVIGKWVFCWQHVSGYMAACWRALQERRQAGIFVVALDQGDTEQSRFDKRELLAGIDCQIINLASQSDCQSVPGIVRRQEPSVLFFGGWNRPFYRQLAYDKDLRHSKKILMMDNPLRTGVRQVVGRVVRRRFLSSMDLVFVTGERSYTAARRLGFPEARIRRGTYGIDYASFSKANAERAQRPEGWPRAFCFIGRYESSKGVSDLLEAYDAYRARVADPWPLEVAGTGPCSSRFQGRPGVTDQGFLQPGEVIGLLARVGCFVLASHYDPWPLVIAETAAAGLPVVCTEACGSSVELVRDFSNGRIVPTGDPKALATALSWIHANYDLLPEMGSVSQALAQPYAAAKWVDRVLGGVASLCTAASADRSGPKEV